MLSPRHIKIVEKQFPSIIQFLLCQVILLHFVCRDTYLPLHVSPAHPDTHPPLHLPVTRSQLERTEQCSLHWLKQL